MPVDCHFLLSPLAIRWVSPGGNSLSFCTLVLELLDNMIQGKPDNDYLKFNILGNYCASRLRPLALAPVRKNHRLWVSQIWFCLLVFSLQNKTLCNLQSDDKHHISEHGNYYYHADYSIRIIDMGSLI